MNAWVLSLIICAAAPLPDGGHCEARAVDYALSREQCKAALVAEGRRIRPPMRLECTEDPALSAALEEMDREGRRGAEPPSPATIRKRH
jgi:hypothetical protein